MQSLIKKVVVALGAAVAVSALCMAADVPADKNAEWTTEKDIFVEMRDGVHLDTDVSLPKGAEGKLATVLVRTPYDKDTLEKVYQNLLEEHSALRTSYVRKHC